MDRIKRIGNEREIVFHQNKAVMFIMNFPWKSQKKRSNFFLIRASSFTLINKKMIKFKNNYTETQKSKH